jgi:hypothetical protein
LRKTEEGKRIMIKVPQSEIVFFKKGKLSLIKIAKYISFVICTLMLICILIFIFIPDPIINALFKGRIIKEFTKTYPDYSLQLGSIHYNIWKDRIGCDSIVLKNSGYTCSVASLSISRISWMKILWQRKITFNTITNSVIDAHKIYLDFPESQIELHFATLHISLPDSDMSADSIKYHSHIKDEQFFAKSRFRQTRFSFDIPQIKITGLDCFALLQGNIYKAGNININGVFADILVNMDKPYDKNSSKPQMPNEALSSINEIVKVNNIKIINGRLKYSERYVVKAKPGVINFTKINISVSGIANHTGHTETAIIQGEGLFMNSSLMKLYMTIPLSSKDFSLKYSGSLGRMDVTQLNSFLEAGEHRRIKSGILQSAVYNIKVNSGHAIGTLRVLYKDLSIAVLNKNTGSEKGIFNRIISLFGKIFVIRGTNMPDDKGKMKIGVIKYIRDPEDYFLQFIWFALRNGVGDVVGFSPK